MSKKLLLSLFLLALSVPASLRAQGTCQWVCAGEECRVEATGDAACEGDLPVIEVTSDLEGEVCLPEPVTLDMATESDAETEPDSEPDPDPDPGMTLIFGRASGSSSDSFSMPADEPAKKDVILTGFCDFGTVKDNPSSRILPGLEKAVKALCGGSINNLTSKCLKVTTGAVRECKVADKIVISLGVWQGSEKVRIERAAMNCYEERNERGELVVKCKVVEGGDDVIQGTSPLPTLPDKIGGYPAVECKKADDSNTYVCNATYYWLCTQKSCAPYFIHIPDIPKTKDEDFIKDMAKLVCDIIAANQKK